MTVSVLQMLLAAGVLPTQARLFEEPLAKAFDRFEISTNARRAAFLAQACHESARFTRLEESLWYSTPKRIMEMWPTRVKSFQFAATLIRNPKELANTVYSNRLGNGGPETGDGWAFRGRGVFQLTGRSNYEAASEGLGVDYVAEPQLVAEPEHAAMTAGWYWASVRGNALADNADIDGVTRVVNGPGMVAAMDRRSAFDDLMRALVHEAVRGLA